MQLFSEAEIEREVILTTEDQTKVEKSYKNERI
jgi:hypothetical protein